MLNTAAKKTDHKALVYYSVFVSTQFLRACTSFTLSILIRLCVLASCNEALLTCPVESTLSFANPEANGIGSD